MECNYDGGDCCLDPLDPQYCSECQCLDGNGSTVDPGTTESPTSGSTSTPGIIDVLNKSIYISLNFLILYKSCLD